ncbi:hypothetical protein [Planococcus sp. ISL-109]|uniref:hypothetical protein n=1 Tax=Planococcus sp. ISL-109 TaxID=2819166 RepID=UPI001BE60BDF|nr:hypothetical protein [Planococcus sp. ISL-109]MBT2583149.1 hypothetical protein [Planococcus sp. ISL-109]
MEHRIFNTEVILVEIEKNKPFGNGTWSETWDWEIIMANYEETYKGRAVVDSRKVNLPWRELNSMDPLTEMIEACKYYMETH